MEINNRAKYFGVMIGPTVQNTKKQVPRCLCSHPYVQCKSKPPSTFMPSRCLLSWGPWLNQTKRDIDGARPTAHSMPFFFDLFKQGKSVGLGLDTDGIERVSIAARFRVASGSATLACGIDRIKAAREDQHAVLASLSADWERRYLTESSSSDDHCHVNRIDVNHRLRNLPVHKMQAGAATLLRQC